MPQGLEYPTVRFIESQSLIVLERSSLLALIGQSDVEARLQSGEVEQDVYVQYC
jgi:hypothetical protein